MQSSSQNGYGAVLTQIENIVDELNDSTLISSHIEYNLLKDSGEKEAAKKIVTYLTNVHFKVHAIIKLLEKIQEQIDYDKINIGADKYKQYFTFLKNKIDFLVKKMFIGNRSIYFSVSFLAEILERDFDLVNNKEIFNAVNEKKELLDLVLKLFYEIKLLIERENLLIERENLKPEIENEVDEKNELIKSGYKLPTKNNVLTVTQTALLIDYLQQNKLLLSYHLGKSKASKIFAVLTKHSNNTLRQKLDINRIAEIRNQSEDGSKGTFGNLEKLKEVLQNIVLSIEDEIKDKKEKL